MKYNNMKKNLITIVVAALVGGLTAFAVSSTTLGKEQTGKVVTAPDGSLLSDGRGTTFTLGGNTLEATASREVDYQGAEVELGVYVNNVSSYQKGVYSVEAYTEQSVLGTAELLLR